MTWLLLLSCVPKRAETAALLSPSDADAWEHLGDAYRRRFHRQLAADAYRTAVQLDPSRASILAKVGGAKSPALRALEHDARRNPLDDELWGDLGDACSASGDVLCATRSYLRAFQLDPVDTEWHTALMNLGQGELVVSAMSARTNFDDDESVGDFADALGGLGRTDEACEQWRRAAEMDPADDEWARHGVECGFGEYPAADTGTADTGTASVVGDLGEIGGVIGGMMGFGGGSPNDDLATLIGRVEQDGDLLVRLGQAYLKAGEREKAEETLWGAVLVSPTDEEALQSYLIAASVTRRIALEKLRDALPTEDEIQGLLADHYLDLGLRAQALAAYKLALTLDPNDTEWSAKVDLLSE